MKFEENFQKSKGNRFRNLERRDKVVAEPIVIREVHNSHS